MSNRAAESSFKRAVGEKQRDATRKDALRLSLCLLTWNEVDGCRIDVPRIARDDYEEVFAVEAGSTDGTVEYLIERGIPVHKQPRPGYNQAYICERHPEEITHMQR
jgi:hypothetical protein